MPELPTHCAFEDWVEAVFARTDPGELVDWDWDEDWHLPFDHLTKLFSSPAFLLEQYTPTQIDQGIYYLISPHIDDYHHVWSTPHLDIQTRAGGVRTIGHLYTDLFAKLYKGLGHQNTAWPGGACYMFWDILGIDYDAAPQQELEASFLDILTTALTLDSESCWESALLGAATEGLGFPRETGEVLRAHNPPPSLRSYYESVLGLLITPDA